MAHDKPIPQNDAVEQNEAAKAGADASRTLINHVMDTHTPVDRVVTTDATLPTDTGSEKFAVASPEQLGERFGKAGLPSNYQYAVLDSADFHVEQATKANNPALAAAMQVYRDNLAQHVTTA